MLSISSMCRCVYTCTQIFYWTWALKWGWEVRPWSHAQIFSSIVTQIYCITQGWTSWRSTFSIPCPISWLEKRIQVNSLLTHHFSCNTSYASSTKKNIPNSSHSHYSSNNLGGEHSFTLDTSVNKNPGDVREHSMWSSDKSSNISPS